MKHHLDVVVALIEGGANPNAENTNGRTQLDWAVLGLPHQGIAKYLVAHGARFSKPENNEVFKQAGDDVTLLPVWKSE